MGSCRVQIASTYRLQLSKQFTFDDAAACAEYLASLGVARVYCSPILQAARGSSHGYDVVDPTRVNEELGGEAAFRRMVAALREHQAAAGGGHRAQPHGHRRTPENPWWWDLLRRTAARAVRRATSTSTGSRPIVDHQGQGRCWACSSDRYGRELAGGELTLVRHGGRRRRPLPRRALSRSRRSPWTVWTSTRSNKTSTRFDAAPRAPALPARVLAQRAGRAELPALLHDRQPDRPARRATDRCSTTATG